MSMRDYERMCRARADFPAATSRLDMIRLVRRTLAAEARELRTLGVPLARIARDLNVSRATLYLAERERAQVDPLLL